MNQEVSRRPKPFSVEREQLVEAISRARHQEAIYGHNTGHFTLGAEKENTIIGVLGEIMVRDHLIRITRSLSPRPLIELCDYGSKFDIRISASERVEFAHVKSGLWKSWPKDNWDFGIHADQGIEKTAAPLVLVTFLKSSKDFPDRGRIEGYLKGLFLSNAPRIKRGEKFPETGVVSRTENILTKFSQYRPIDEILNQALSEQGDGIQ